MKSRRITSILSEIPLSKGLIKIKELFYSKRKIFESTIYLIIGILTSSCKIIGNISPFGIAFAAASPQNYKLHSAVGAVLGYILFSSLGGLKYIAAVILLIAINSISLLSDKIKKNDFFAPVSAFLSVILSCGTYSLLSGFNAIGFAVAVSEAMLASGCSYFFLHSFSAVSCGIFLAPLRERVCLLLVTFLTLVGLTPVSIFSLSLGRILTVLLILLTSLYYKESGGAIAGVCGGSAMLLSSNDFSFLAYSLGGLIAGIFSIFGKSGTALSFIAVNSITIALLYSKNNPISLITEVLFASLIFLLFPTKPLFFSSKFQKTTADSSAVQNIAISKLSFASRALKNIAQTTSLASQKITEITTAEDTTRIYSSACDKICKKCIKNASCWQLKYNETTSIMNQLISEMNVSGVAVFPQLFSSSCKNSEALLTEINKNFLEYSSRLGSSHQISLLRSSITEQFEGMSEMLEYLSDDIRQVYENDPALTDKIKDLFEEKLLSPHEIDCYKDKYQKLVIEAQIPSYKLSRLSNAYLPLSLSEITNCDIADPAVTSNGNFVRLVFCEKPRYQLTYAVSSKSKNGNVFCGDSSSIVSDISGNTHVILSDGMGSGREAALSSSIAVGLMTRLAQSGFYIEAALKMVNSALIVKSGDESLATIDAATFDLYTGKVIFYKAGAAPTYIKRGEKLGKIESISMPAGILGGVTFDKNTLSLKHGDIIIMASDGLTSFGEDWLKNEIVLHENESVADMAQRICLSAYEHSKGDHQDDITVIALLISKNTEN